MKEGIQFLFLVTFVGLVVAPPPPVVNPAVNQQPQQPVVQQQPIQQPVQQPIQQQPIQQPIQQQPVQQPIQHQQPVQQPVQQQPVQQPVQQPAYQQQQAQQQNQYATNNNQQQQNNNQQQQNNNEQQRPVDAMTQLAKHPQCLADVQRLCKAQMTDEDGKKRDLQHNFEVLDCFNSYEGDEVPPSKPCQTLIYEYKRLLTTDDRFESAAKDVCSDLIVELDGNKECYGSVKGAFLPCFMELAWGYDDEKGNEKHKNCLNFMNKMQRVIFSDYHLVHPFLEACKNEVKATECGLIFSDTPKKEEEKDSVDHHNQGPALDCLMKTDMRMIGEPCKHQMMRIVELQSDDYHLDRPLYFACRADRERFCAKVPSGEGKVYKCLMEHTQDNSLSPDCHEQVIKREQLMLEDAKADKTFYMACLPILKKTECHVDAKKHEKAKEIGMAAVLKCLLDYEEQNEELDVPVECQKEIELFQSNLMDEYKISPGIVHYCDNEIHAHCSGLRKANEQDGTVHCLMGLAMPTRNMDERGDKQGQSKLSTECLAQINILVDETRGPAQSVLAIDKFLHEQCASEFNEFCASSKEPLDCLMLQIQEGKIDQSTDCARHLLELEYFISRNYKHDMKLVKACHKDIQTYNLDHHLRKKENGPESDGLVFAQLYKIIREQLGGGTVQKAEISHPCINEVLRSVHERAVSIDLNPELEEKCLPDLISICSKAQHGEELGCLQEHVDKLKSGTVKDPGCKEMVSEWIISQDADYKLDYILMKSCQPTIKKYCEDVVNGVQEGEIDEGEIIKCLIDNKYDEDMDKKCFAGIEHHQLVNMQDFNFNKNFRESCKEDFKTHCEHVKSKSGVVYCLSDIVRNDTLLEQKHRVSPKCRDELRAEFLALEDTINLDPEFADVCKKDLDDHCEHVKPGPGADAQELYLDCLRSTDPEELRPKCGKYVFKIAKLQNAVAGASSHVFRACKPEIKKYCAEHTHDPETLLTCLDENYDDSSKRCQKALDADEEEDNQDIRLNPALYLPCKDDIHEFCEKEFNKGHDDQSLHGAVIECLKLEYVKGPKSGLSETCSNQMHLLVVKVQTRDYKQDYVLTHACKAQIKECAGKDSNEKHIIKCLREKLMQGDLKEDVACQSEVFRLITENRVDIHTDAELHEACVADIRDSDCKTVTAGSGRVMSCLLSLYDAGTIKNKKCIEMVKNRKELWEHAAKLSPPESLSQVWDDLTTSNSRWYFMSVICAVLAVILVLGVVCGRASKRVAAEIKDR